MSDNIIHLGEILEKQWYEITTELTFFEILDKKEEWQKNGKMKILLDWREQKKQKQLDKNKKK
tara:strand:+ start:1250 stop:1438 length:189 start_codon:yes stop_codon:yes gene_type:complete